MQQSEKPKNGASQNKAAVPLSETIPNAHTSGDGALRLSEDGLVEPDGQTIADADAAKSDSEETLDY